MTHVSQYIIVVVLVALGPAPMFAGAAPAEPELKYFRSDLGIAEEGRSLPQDLGSDVKPRWRVAIDSGHSTPILAKGKIFLTTYRADAQELATVALEESTGKLLWKRVASATKIEDYHRQTGNPATCTPAWDGKRLYVFFGSFGLICYDFEGGKIWEHRLGPFQDEYGAGSSPVLIDNKVVLCQDHDVDSFVMALDRDTGKTLWKTARPDAVRSYSTPVVWQRNGAKELLIAGALELASYDPATGEKLWWVGGLARIVIPAPVPSGEMIYMASWAPGGDAGKRIAFEPWESARQKFDKNHDGKLTRAEIENRDVLDRFYRMDLNQDGSLDKTEWNRHAAVFQNAENAVLAIKPSSSRGRLATNDLKWKYPRGVPYVATPLVHNGLFWMVKDGGIVTKLDAASGRFLQEERLPGVGSYYASPVAGDEKLYFASEQGVVSVVAEQADWNVLSSHDFHEKIYATPVAEHGRLFIRTEKALYCF